MKLRGILALVTAGTLALTALPTVAQIIPVSDTLTTYRNGVQVDNRTVFEDQEPMAAPALIDHNTVNLGLYGAPILIFEPDGRTLSDIVGVVNGGGLQGLGFLSDPFGVTAQELAAWFGGTASGTTWTVTPFRTFDENPVTGITLDVTHFVNPSLQAAGYTAVFTSDGDVPDGGLTVALLGFALVGVEGLRRNLRK